METFFSRMGWPVVCLYLFLDMFVERMLLTRLASIKAFCGQPQTTISGVFLEVQLDGIPMSS